MEKDVDKTFLNKFFMYKTSIELMLIINFGIGLFFSFFTNGIFYLIFFTILYELMFYSFTKGEEKYWNPVERCALFLDYILGWMIGRFIFVNTLLQGEDFFNTGLPIKEDFYL